MRAVSNGRIEGWGRGIRFVLGCAVVLAAFWAVGGRLLPSSCSPIKPAQADVVAASPGYLALSVTPLANNRFYLVDTKVQAFCVYQMSGEKLRLVSVRDFSRDTDIVDSSALGATVGGQGNVVPFEGGSGITVRAARAYADLQKVVLEKEEKLLPHHAP